MGMSGLPDMYTQSLRATGPRAEGVHIRQTMNAHGITVSYIPSPGELEPAQARNHANLQPNCIYGEG